MIPEIIPVDFLKKSRDLPEYLLPVPYAGFLPYPGILVGVRLDLRTVYVCMAGIHIFHLENLSRDGLEYILAGAAEFMFDEVPERRIRRSCHSIQKPHIPDIRPAEFLEIPQGSISVLHEGKQDDLQQFFGITSRPAGPALLTCKNFFQVDPIHDFAETVHRIGNIDLSFNIQWQFQLFYGIILFIDYKKIYKSIMIV